MNILTPTGYKDAALLSIGDQVIGAGGETNTIEELSHMVYDLTDPEQAFDTYTINGTHTFFQENLVPLHDSDQIRHARELNIGDIISDDAGNPITISTITTAPATDWWRFIISGDHLYNADGILLHNNTISFSNTAGGILTTAGNWTGGVAPGAGDDATIGSSITGGVSLNGANWSVHGVDFTGYANTFTSTGTRTWTIGGVTTLTTAAAFKLGSGMTFTGGGTLTMLWDNRSGALTVTSNGVTMNGITTLQTDANVAASVADVIADPCNVGSATVTMRRGGLTVNSSQSFTTTGLMQYTGTAGTFTLTYNTSNVNCGQWGNTGTGTWATSANIFSFLTITAQNTNTNTFGAYNYGGTTTINANNQGMIPCTTSSSTWFFILTLTSGGPKDGATISSDLTFGGGFNANTSGAQANHRFLLQSNGFNITRTLTVTGVSFSLTDFDCQDIAFSGATATGTRLGDGGGNSGITFDSPKTVYYVGHQANWSDANIWATSSGGAGATANQPLAQDTAIFDASSFNANGQTVTFDTWLIAGINTSASTTNTHVFQQNQNTYLMGNIVLSNKTSFNQLINVSYITAKRGTQTWTSNGATYGVGGAVVWMDQRNVGGTLQFTDDFTIGSSNTLSGHQITFGTLNPLGNFTHNFIRDSGNSTKAFTGTAGKTLQLIGAASATNIILLTNTGTTCTPNGMNLTLGQSATTGTSWIISLPDSTWGDLILWRGANTGNAFTFSTSTATNLTFNTMQMAGAEPATSGTPTVTLRTGTTYTVTSPYNFLRGTSTAAKGLTTISATSTAVTLVCNAGYIVTDYINLSNNTGSGAVPFFAGSHSTNSGGNTNWNFTDVPEGLPLAAAAEVPLINSRRAVPRSNYI